MIGLGLGAAALAACGAVCLRGALSPRSRILGPVVWRGLPGERRVALTFDDGPWPGSTDAVLDILERETVPACFFVIGRYATERPETLQRMRQDGHLVGNHSFEHSHHGIRRRRAYWHSELERTDEAVDAAIGVRPLLFRPPMGWRNHHIAAEARGSGRTVVTWTTRGRDGLAREPEPVERRVLAQCGPGHIVLLHDGSDPFARRDPAVTVRALPRIIDGLRRAGLEFGRLDQVTGLRPYR